MNHKVILLFLCLILVSSVCFSQVSEERYHTSDEIETELNNYATVYSDLAQLRLLGYTLQDSLPLYALKISDNVESEEDEPAIFYMGSMHAEEILGIEVAMFMIDSLLTGYADGNQQIQWWVDNCEIWIMPDVNPEGHQVVMDELDIYYRKNKRDNNNNGILDFNPGLNTSPTIGEGMDDYDGVDLNRNWDYHWENSPDSEPTWNPASGNYYRGPAPFSENEVALMRDLLRDEKVVLALFMHSSRKGDPDSPYTGSVWYFRKWDRRERFFYPWTYQLGWGDISPDFWTIRDMAASMADNIAREDQLADIADCQSVGGPSCNNIPSCYRCDLLQTSKRGVARDYAYARLGIYALNVEVGRWIQPPGEFVDPFCRKLMNGATYLLDRAFFGGISGLVTDSATGRPLEAQVKILQLYDPVADVSPRTTDSNTGRFYRFLLPNGAQNFMYHLCHKDWPTNPPGGNAPGNYTLEVSKPGYDTVTIPNLQVNNDTLTIVDVEMDYQGFMNGFPVLTEPVIYSSPTLHDLEHDEIPEIVFASREGAIHAIKSFGQEMEGWPQYTDGHEELDETSTPAIGDVDFDGQFEIAFGSVDGNLYVWHPDGTSLAGFPVDLGQPVIQSAAVLCDIDADNKLEIFIGVGNEVHAYHFDGTPVTGWPQELSGPISSTIAIADIDFDETVEIVAISDEIYLWEIDGSAMPLSPFGFEQELTGSPALADIDGDGDLEIFFGGKHGSLWGIHHDLALVENFSKIISDGSPESSEWQISTPAIGDLDRNVIDLEIVFGLSTPNSDFGLILAYHHDGELVEGFPVELDASVIAAPILANVDGESEPEIIFGTSDGFFHVIDSQGSAIEGFPFPISETAITGTAAVGDLDGDYRAEFVIGSPDGGLFAFETNQVLSQNSLDWPMFQHNHFHTGYKDFHDVVNSDEELQQEFEFALFAAFPNPARSQTTISYTLPQTGPVKLSLYNLAGQRVKTITDGIMKIGPHSVIWDGCNDNHDPVSSGIYFFRLEMNDLKANQKFVLIK